MSASAASGLNEHPPKPCLALRVGILGYGSSRLSSNVGPGLEECLDEILKAIRAEAEQCAESDGDFFAPAPPLLRAISSLAEGGDRFFAEAALDQGYELCCPMPFPQAEYENDFAPGKAAEPDSIDRFKGLLDRAKNGAGLTVFELDGGRANEAEAYRAARRVVFNQSDVLVVIWDGVGPDERGAAQETADEARGSNMPVVWINAQSPDAWEVLDASSPAAGDHASPPPGGSVETLGQTVRDALVPPTSRHVGASSGTPGEGIPDPRRQITLDDFYTERKPRFKLAVIWECFRDVLGDCRRPRPAFRVADFEQEVEQEWPRDQSSPAARIVDRLRPFYAWSDKLAVVYSSTYRSAFILTYLLAAAAVGMALLSLATGWYHEEPAWKEAACVLFELVMILAILAIVLQGRRRRWHERWIDYRLVAELVRHSRLVVPLGGDRPLPEIPAHLASYGHPAGTWIAWYVRAMERDIGLPSARVDKEHVARCLGHLASFIDGQVKHHQRAGRRCRRIERRLHWLGISLLVLTLLACILHLLPKLVDSMAWLEELSGLLTLLCAFLPALGAAVSGINNQGEFRRVARRSEAMFHRLSELRKRVEALERRAQDSPGRRDAATSTQALALASEAALCMVNEVLDWRVVFVDRPLQPPA